MPGSGRGCGVASLCQLGQNQRRIAAGFKRNLTRGHVKRDLCRRVNGMDRFFDRGLAVAAAHIGNVIGGHIGLLWVLPEVEMLNAPKTAIKSTKHIKCDNSQLQVGPRAEMRKLWQISLCQAAVSAHRTANFGQGKTAVFVKIDDIGEAAIGAEQEHACRVVHGVAIIAGLLFKPNPKPRRGALDFR